MAIPDDEALFRIIDPVRDFHRQDDGTERLRSSVFSTSYPISFNRASIWPLAQHEQLLDQHPKLASEGWGLFSIMAAAIRGVKGPNRPDLDVIPDPILYPAMDPLIQMENRSHASLSRPLLGNEPRQAARIASQRIHRRPRHIG